MIDLDELQAQSEIPKTFQELLTQYEENNSLYITFATWLCLDKITYVDFQKLAKWTGCYEYIIPKEQDIIPELSDLLYQRSRYNLFSLALLVSHLRANLSLEQQHLLFERLKSLPQENSFYTSPLKRE
jgi:hypothetical protein